VTLSLRKDVEGLVTAADIQTPHDVEIINPDHVIANLSHGGKLDMQIKVEKGRGYVPGSMRRYDPVGVAVLLHPSDATDGNTHAWPLGDLAGTDCLVLSGSDATTVLDAARTARDGDAWQSAGATYDVVFRPLLPDEHTCDDVST